MENWKPVKGYEGLYEVSDFGNVRTLDPRHYQTVKTQKKNKDGHMRVWLSRNSKKRPFFVHRLVAISFIPNPENKPVVNHIDGNPSNNHVSNLEWSTRSENDKHAFRLGMRKPSNGGTNKYVVRIDKSGKEVIYDSMLRAARENELSVGLISYYTKTGRQYGNYKWRLLDEGVTTIRKE